MWTLPIRRLALCLALAVCALPAVAEEDETEGKPELVNFDRLWNYGKPDETEARFRELLPAAEASGNLEYRLQLMTQIGRTLGLQGKFEEAHALLDCVEEELTKETPVAHVRYLLERGRAFNSSKKVKEAHSLFLEAWERAQKAKADLYALDAAHMMGIVEPPEKQLAWTEKALKIAEDSEDKRVKGWLGTLYNNLGWSYFDLKRYEEALEIHRKGWAWRKVQKQPKPTLIAKWAVARMLRALGRIQEALEMQRELLVSWEDLKEENGFVHEELAECQLAIGDAEEAALHFENAWRLLKDKKWLEEGEPERYARLREKAGVEAPSED